ncbi:uncharacterized protein PHACADRAFT_116755 [Phanerochaete carnosa HHB-10118-sp]|uniref:Transmembrane protein n=1 Tax=Phanerochaete carnosa (strain HHB-10118-sp) TaxID=650164 RepID=K5WFL3_PHACS|nr:uncharacterized protein PHACADRAFT_116755 [Phanerochaete carnosa HHB-10118-sp]EKM58095.1 hypothetical protein PHACADRAFT_116755 [Phanerochaete carnosa HHB-10118-sp]
MPAWNSLAELALEASAFARLMHALAGLYFWEVATSLGFDWQFITGEKEFHWPLIFYFLGRYLLVFAMIGILTALDVTTEVNCQALYTFNQLVGQATIGLASINLAIRTMVLWSQNLYIVVPLVLVILGHWSLILQGVLLKAEWVPDQGCVITHTNNTVLAATFIYSMCFDLIVLVLTAAKLAFPRGQRSQLMRMLFRDGLIYFVIAFLSNLLATTFILLNLSAVMSVIFNVPSAIASTIAACRAVRRLNGWSSSGPEVFSNHIGNQIHSAPVAVSRPFGMACTSESIRYPHSRKASGGVHIQVGSHFHLQAWRRIQMESFAITDLETTRTNPSPPTFETIENPEISGDYKRPPF